MHIFNAMFGRGLGGIEQSFLDYSRGLVASGQRVTSLVHPKAKILPLVEKYALPVVPVPNAGVWDMVAIYRLAKLIKTEKPDVIIAHGGRAATLLRKAARGKVPVVGVCHNYSTSRLVGCNALFTVTEDLKQTVIRAGQPAASVYAMPNMVSLPAIPPSLPKPRHTPPVIGTLGRFVPKKGFSQFIAAIRLLQAQGIACRAVLAGDGEEREALLKGAQGMEDILTFPGWVKDKDAFFCDIDIFCLPSLDEPFGIVLLEAFQYGIPVVSTGCKGPDEIIQHGSNGLLTPIHDAKALAAGLATIIQDKNLANALAIQGYETVRSRYAMPVVAARMVKVLEEIIGG